MRILLFFFLFLFPPPSSLSPKRKGETKERKKTKGKQHGCPCRSMKAVAVNVHEVEGRESKKASERARGLLRP
jgi:hypothetical protein